MMNQTVRMVKTPKPYPLEKALYMGERDKELLARTCLEPHVEYLERELGPSVNDTRAAFSRSLQCIEEYMRHRCVGAGVPNGTTGRGACARFEDKELCR